MEYLLDSANTYTKRFDFTDEMTDLRRLLLLMFFGACVVAITFTVLDWGHWPRMAWWYSVDALFCCIAGLWCIERARRLKRDGRERGFDVKVKDNEAK